jgi:hypothetical protein
VEAVGEEFLAFAAGDYLGVEGGIIILFFQSASGCLGFFECLGILNRKSN